ncbi:uncharacterized protein LOC135815137 isoform X2 [Sycon ciliatum]|uniref:uncharacterized protein LOC135815137 isoform X2 n=1 Tax=Sycon ciliatum TaxID=27933 RepID=UPI0031F6F0ED
MSEGLNTSFSAESAIDTSRALDETRRWIEECTGSQFPSDDFRLSLRDGVLLCKLANVIQEGSVNLKRVQTGAQATFVWLENLNYFIKACQQLGLKGGQLFDPTELIAEDHSEVKIQSGKRTEQERRVRNVAITVYWLGKKANRIKTFEGPKLNLTEFQNIVPSAVHHEEDNREATPEHDPSPAPDKQQDVLEEIIETEVITTVTTEVRRVVKLSPNMREVVREDVSTNTAVEERPRTITKRSSASELRSAFMKRSSSSDLNQSSASRLRVGSRSRNSGDMTSARPRSGAPEAQADSESLALCLDLGSTETEFGFTLEGAEKGVPTSIATVEKGSSADRANLHVADKVFWVNGESVAFSSLSEVEAQVTFICKKERVITLGIRRLIPTKVPEQIPESAVEAEPSSPPPATKVEEEAVAMMVAQTETGPTDLATALKEFEDKVEAAEVAPAATPEPAAEDRSPAAAGVAVAGVAVLSGFSTHNTGAPSGSPPATASREKVTEEAATMSLQSDDQSTFTPHGQAPTACYPLTRESVRNATASVDSAATDDTTKLGLATAAAAVVVETELPKSDVQRRRWNSSSTPPGSGLQSPEPPADEDMSLAAVLRRVQKKHGDEEDAEKCKKLVALVSTPGFSGVVEAHRGIGKANAAAASAEHTSQPSQTTEEPACPVCRRTNQAVNSSDNQQDADDSAALAEVMGSPHFRALCWTHDQLLQKRKREGGANAPPAVTASSAASSTTAQAVGAAAAITSQREEPLQAAAAQSKPSPKPTHVANGTGGAATAAAVAAATGAKAAPLPRIIIVQKQAKKPLGATIRTEDGKVFVARLMAGSSLAQSGQINADDQILEINGKPIQGKSISEISAILGEIPVGDLSMKIQPAETAPATGPTPEVNVRALFDYDPATDELLPCKEVGLAFKKGDVLHVVNRHDVDWWQAVKEDEDDAGMAGLIPSKYLQERRDSYQQIVDDDGKRASQKKRKSSKVRLPKRKKKKASTYEAKQNAYNFDEVHTYEEVFLVKPDPAKRRPIVIVGPLEGGREDLKARLVDHDPEKFNIPIPHTTRPMRPDEKPGEIYHFITQKEFETKMKSNEFFEHGQHRENFYGTALRSVTEVIMSGHTCVVTAHPEALALLRASNMVPYVVFLRPPSLSTEADQPQLAEESDQARGHQLAYQMEVQFGHLFDKTIVNHDIEVSLQEMLETAHFLQTRPQWVPLTRRST